MKNIALAALSLILLPACGAGSSNTEVENQAVSSVETPELVPESHTSEVNELEDASAIAPESFEPPVVAVSSSDEETRVEAQSSVTVEHELECGGAVDGTPSAYLEMTSGQSWLLDLQSSASERLNGVGVGAAARLPDGTLVCPRNGVTLLPPVEGRVSLLMLVQGRSSSLEGWLADAPRESIPLRFSVRPARAEPVRTTLDVRAEMSELLRHIDRVTPEDRHPYACAGGGRTLARLRSPDGDIPPGGLTFHLRFGLETGRLVLVGPYLADGTLGPEHGCHPSVDGVVWQAGAQYDLVVVSQSEAPAPFILEVSSWETSGGSAQCIPSEWIPARIPRMSDRNLERWCSIPRGVTSVERLFHTLPESLFVFGGERLTASAQDIELQLWDTAEHSSPALTARSLVFGGEESFSLANEWLLLLRENSRGPVQVLTADGTVFGLSSQDSLNAEPQGGLAILPYEVRQVEASLEHSPIPESLQARMRQHTQQRSRVERCFRRAADAYDARMQGKGAGTSGNKCFACSAGPEWDACGGERLRVSAAAILDVLEAERTQDARANLEAARQRMDALNPGVNAQGHAPSPASVGAVGTPDACESAVSCEGSFVIDSPEALRLIQGCSEISGDLEIRRNQMMTTSPVLPCLTRVGGALRIRHNPALQDVSGLSSLQEVGGRLDIVGNPVLVRVTGLGALTALDAGLHITRNRALQSVDGLQRLSLVWGGLTIAQNDALQGLAGLGSVSRVSDMTIEENASLTSFEELRALVEINGDVRVRGNGALRDLSGLDGVMAEVGAVSIERNESLVSLGGIFNRTGSDSEEIALYDELRICDNPRLTDLEGLSGLRYVQAMTLERNDSLTTLEGLSTLESVEFLSIQGNTRLRSLRGLRGLESVDSVVVHQNGRLPSFGYDPSPSDYYDMSSGDAPEQFLEYLRAR